MKLGQDIYQGIVIHVVILWTDIVLDILIILRGKICGNSDCCTDVVLMFTEA